MDAGDRIRAIQARMLAGIQQQPSNTIQSGQVPNNPPLTPDQIATIKANYPATNFSFQNLIYPCNTTSTFTTTVNGRPLNFTSTLSSATLCSTIYLQTYAVTSTMGLVGTTTFRGQYYNATN